MSSLVRQLALGVVSPRLSTFIYALPNHDHHLCFVSDGRQNCRELTYEEITGERVSESTGCVYVKSGPSFKILLCVFIAGGNFGADLSNWILGFLTNRDERKISVGHVCVSLCSRASRTHTSLMKLVHLLKHELHGYQDWHRTTSLAKAMLDVYLMWPRVVEQFTFLHVAIAKGKMLLKRSLEGSAHAWRAEQERQDACRGVAAPESSYFNRWKRGINSRFAPVTEWRDPSVTP